MLYYFSLENKIFSKLLYKKYIIYFNCFINDFYPNSTEKKNKTILCSIFSWDFFILDSQLIFMMMITESLFPQLWQLTCQDNETVSSWTPFFSSVEDSIQTTVLYIHFNCFACVIGIIIISSSHQVLMQCY